MNIVLITSKLSFEHDGSPVGGSVVDLHLKAKELAALGHEVTVVTAFSESNQIVSLLPYAVIERRIRGRGLLGLQFGIYRLLREFERDADAFYLDGHMFLYGGGAYRALGGRVPVAAFFNIRLNSWADTSGNAPSRSFYQHVKRAIRCATERLIGSLIANRLDSFIFNTPQVQKLYRDFGVGRRKPSTVIEDFVETEALSVRFGITAAYRKMHEECAHPVRFLATGRMIPEKGFAMLLCAFSKANESGTYRLVLSGGGPEKERLQKLAEELGVARAVSFPGWVEREKLYKFFKEAHVFIFPRWWSEYGSAVLTEAFAFGLPSIIPGGGALEWLVSNAALTFENGNVDELAARIGEFGENAALRVTFAARALERAAALDARALAKRLERVLIALRSRG